MVYFSRHEGRDSGWSFAEWMDAYRKLLRRARDLRHGDLVAYMSDFHVLPFFGVVCGNNGDSFDVATRQGIERYPFEEADDDWTPPEDRIVCIPVSRSALRDARRFLANTRIDRWSHPDFWQHYGDYVRGYAFSKLTDEATIFGMSMGFGVPGRVAPGRPEDERVKAVVATLPGYGSVVRPGYIGWLAYADYARTVECDGWREFVEFVAREGMQVYDFYFGEAYESASCPVCHGSGISADYQELEKGFHACGTGRWAGWSENLHQDEIDLLVELRRIDVPEGARLTPENYREHLHSFSLDAVAAYRLAELRAARLGIPTGRCVACDPCEDEPESKKYSSGNVAVSGRSIQLCAWVGTPCSERAYVVQVNDVDEGDMPEIARFMAAAGRKLVAGLSDFARNGELVVGAVAGRLQWNGDGWNSDCACERWQKFAEDFHVDDLNLPVGYAMATAAGDPRKIADGTRMAVFLLHPRKGAHRTVFIEGVSEADRASIVEVFATGARLHEHHFEWAETFGGVKE